MAESPTTGITDVRTEGVATIVSLAGEIDLAHSPRIHRELVHLCDGRPERIILDLTAVGYMDSSGVGTLVEVYRRVQGYGGRLVLAGAQDKVRSIFEIAQLDRIFTFCNTLAEALEA